MRSFSFLIFILIFNLTLQFAHANPNPDKTTYKILFIGSSYFTYNNLPDLFQNLANSDGKTVYIELQTAGGPYLADHASSSLTEAKINEQNWDYVILQGVGSLTAYPESFIHHPVYPALVTLRNKINNNCETTKMVFCLPWAYEDGMTWAEGWADTYEDMQRAIYENTLQYSNDIGFEISPVGWAWNTILREQNYPLHYLHMSDWNHPSLKGSYVMACVVFSTIYQEGTTDISYYGGVPADEANYFQTVASNMVLDSLDLWNITPSNIESNNLLKPHELKLYQNYPNPFNPHTNIDFEIYQPAVINLSIYNMLGNKVRTLIKNSKYSKGVYNKIWDGKNDFGTKAPSGIYFYNLKTSTGFNSVKKMILMK